MAQSTKQLTYEVDGSTKSINLWNEAGTDIRSTYDIVNDIAKSWKNMSDVEKSALAIQLSGKNQMDVFLSTLTNFESAQRAYTTALTASGSAMKEQEAYAESLQFKLTALKAEWERLVLGDGVIESTIKGFTNLGTAVLKFANSDLGQITIGVAGAVTALKTLQTAIEAVRQAQELKMATDIASAEANLTLASTGKAIIAFGKYALVIGAVASAFYLAKKAQEAYFPTIEQTAKKLEKASQEYEDNTQKVQQLQEQLFNVNKAINDIKNQGKLEITDEHQLDLLTRQRVELENQLTLAKQVKIESGNKLNREADISSRRTYNLTYFTGNMDKTASTYDDAWAESIHNGSITAIDALNKLSEGLETAQQNIGKNIDKIDEYKISLQEGTITQEQYDEAVEKLRYENTELVKGYNANMNASSDFLEVVAKIADSTSEQSDVAQKAIDTWNESTKTIASTADSTSEYGAKLQDISDIIGENTDANDENEQSVKTLNDATSDLQKNLKPLNSAYKEFSKNGKVTASSLMEIQNRAKEVGLDFTDIINKMTSANATTEDVNDGFNEMSNQLTSASGILKQLTLDNADLIEKLLEEQGIMNAHEVVTNELKEVQQRYNEALQNSIDANSRQASSLGNATLAYYNMSGGVNTTTTSINGYIQAIIASNGTIIDTSADIANLSALEQQAWATAMAVYQAKQTQYWEGQGYIPEKARFYALHDTQRESKNYLNKIKKDSQNLKTTFSIPTTTSGGGGSPSGSSKATDPVEEAKKQLEDFQKLHKQILDDRLKYLDHELKQEVISVEEHNQLKQRAYGQYFSALSSMGIDYSQEQNEFFDEQREWLQKRFEDSIKYEQHLIDRQIKALQKQKDEESDDYDDQIERLEEKRDKIVDALDEEIDLREEQKDAELDAIKEEQDAIKKKHDEVINNLKTQIDILKEEKSANKEAWDERIAQLDAVNDELEKQKQLEEKLEALAKARATRVKIFKNGRFVYDVDREAVSEAQKNLNEYKEKLRQERAKKSLQDQRDAEQKNYEERIDALEKYKDQQDKYYDEIEKRLDDNYDAVEKKYKDLLDALKKQRDSEKKLYDDKIKNLQKLKKESEKEYQDMIDDLNDLKDSYSDALEDMENVQNGFLDATKAFTYDYSKSMEENLKAFMEYVTGVKDGYKELEQAEKQANASSSGSSSSSGGKDYKDISQFSDPSEQHKAWEEAGSPSSSSYSVPDGHGGSTSSLADKYGGIVTSKYSTSHANGVASIGSDELAIVGENPNKEIVVGSRVNNGTLMSLNRGTGVINAKSTRTLAGLVNSIGGSNNLIDRNTSVVQTFSFDKIVLPNVTNANSFVEALSREFNNRAIQYGNIRR